MNCSKCLMLLIVVSSIAFAHGFVLFPIVPGNFLDSISSLFSGCWKSIYLAFQNVLENVWPFKWWINSHTRLTVTGATCLDKVSLGPHTMKFSDGSTKKFECNCGFPAANECWFIAQFRPDAKTVPFANRTWLEYKYGFGNFDQGYWVGLDLINKLVASAPTVYMAYITSTGYVEYKNTQFKIAGETNYYKVVTLGREELTTYRPNMTVGTRFSTTDQSSTTCTLGAATVQYNGGFWFSNPNELNINGNFADASTITSMLIRI